MLLLLLCNAFERRHTHTHKRLHFVGGVFDLMTEHKFDGMRWQAICYGSNGKQVTSVRAQRCVYLNESFEEGIISSDRAIISLAYFIKFQVHEQ